MRYKGSVFIICKEHIFEFMIFSSFGAVGVYWFVVSRLAPGVSRIELLRSWWYGCYSEIPSELIGSRVLKGL
jgi:hypothetical protein